MGKRKIAAIDPGHRTAKICAETIDADIYDFKFRERHTYLGLIEAALKVFVIPKYDIYFLGTIHAMFFIFLRETFFREKCIAVARVNDTRFELRNPLKRFFMKTISKKVDGFIPISNKVSNDIRNFFGKENPRSIVIRNFLRDNKFLNVDPDLRSKNLMIVGRYKKMKGIDILLKTFQRIKFDSKLYIIGIEKNELEKELNELSEEKRKRVVITGYIPDWGKLSKDCTFYVQPGRGDAGGNSVLEAMATGLIPIVSYKVGNKDFVEEVNSGLVIHSLDVDEYVTKLNQLASKDVSYLSMLSKKSKEVASRRTKEKGEEEFREKFFLLIHQLTLAHVFPSHL